MRRKRLTALVACTLWLTAACSSNTTGADLAEPVENPGTGGDAIGFIYVGPKDDFGYNQAAYEGAEAVAEALDDFEILHAENVPEDDNAARIMEDMIDKGAKIIFATSYGHLDPALKVARAHPDVVIIQQGNLVDGEMPANFGTYFGTVYEPVYLAGIAAGQATETNKLGFVYAFPIPQTINNINAFTLGARSVNPDATVNLVNTSNWCDPGKQAEAASSLISQGVDVITQHQDCTATIIKTAEGAGVYSVGYHADASELAPEGWLTGSEWDWGPLYVDIVQTILDGQFTGGRYNSNYRVGLKNGQNPFVQSEFGPAVTERTARLVETAKAEISAADGSPFKGPVRDQEGNLLVEDDEVPDYATIEGITVLVEGVIGQLPS